MRLGGWLHIYLYISRAMGYSILKDQLTPLILLLLNIGRVRLGRHIVDILKDRNVFIFGGGGSLLRGVMEFRKWLDGRPRDGIRIVSCDVSTKILLSNNIPPDIVVSDLDGDPASLIKSSIDGAVMVIHGHGDNLYEVLKISRRLRSLVVSTQVIPIPPLVNYYGYTDGDRAILMAIRAGARRIFLIGMDFRGIIDPYKEHRPGDSHIKRWKLSMGKIILSMNRPRMPEIYIIDGGGLGDIYNVVSWSDLDRLIP